MKRLLLPLFLTVLLAAPTVVSAQAIECDNQPISMGEIPAEIQQACAQPVAEVVFRDPTDLAAGVNNSADTFVTFTQNAPETFTTVGGPIDQSGTAFTNAGDFAGNDFSVWYALDNENNFFSVDAATAATTSIATATAPAGGETYSGMSWDYETSQMYVISTNQSTSTLGTINLATGEVTTIGATGMALAIGIGVHPDGQMYALDIAVDQLFSVDKATGAATAVGPIGFDANFGQGMDFDNADGTCYLYAVNAVGPTVELRTCDTATGATTLVGTLGTTAPGGLNQMGSGSSMTEAMISTNEAGSELPTSVTLGEGYPNPFNPSASVPFTVNETTEVRLSVYDALGREVAVLATGRYTPGAYTVSFDAADLPSGTYMTRLEANGQVQSRSLTLLK